MRDLIIAIFGTYSPVTTQVWNETEQVYDTVVASGAAGVDWTYVLGVFGFFLVLYCILRILGSVISRV